MTDKQILIDGVDVSGCIYYKNKSCIVDYYLADIPFDEAKCELNPNCYYKQLKRKEQSEAKLVKQIQTICDFINNRPEIFKGVYGGVDKIITEYAERKEHECEALTKNYFTLIQQRNAAEQQLDQLKQTLTEIKGIAEDREVFCENCSSGEESFTCDDCGYVKILQKISEVEND